jgi:hypothetical protein
LIVASRSDPKSDNFDAFVGTTPESTMFVRWKRKRRKDDRRGWGKDQIVTPQWLLSAVLVESVRINGKPRQRTIRYLGSIREQYLDLSEGASTARRFHFWRGVEWSLDQLELSDLDRVRIIAAIEERVPQPTSEDIQRNNERRDELEHRLKVLQARAGVL